MEKRIILLTGSPGIGKTTVLTKILESLKAKGFRVGGMISREVRLGGARVGFEIQDIQSLKRGWLAHKDQKIGPKVGKYRVNIADLDSIGADAIVRSILEADVVVIDEIGPMELFSEKFKQAVRKAVESGKPIVSVVHWKVKDKLIDEVKARNDVEMFFVHHNNRDMLPEVVTEKIIELLRTR